MHLTALRPVGLTLFHVEVRTNLHDEVQCYSSWKRTSGIRILLAIYIYAF